MDPALKIVKVSAVLLFIFVLVVLCAPTLKGPFVIIHFATTLKAWLLVQMVFLGFVRAAHLLFSRILLPRRSERPDRTSTITELILASEPLRC